MFFNVVNICLVLCLYKIYKRIPRTTGLTLDYFKGKLEDYDNIPTY